MEVVWFIINTLADEAVKMRHKVEADIRRQAEQTGKEVS